MIARLVLSWSVHVDVLKAMLCRSRMYSSCKDNHTSSYRCVVYLPRYGRPQMRGLLWHTYVAMGRLLD